MELEVKKGLNGFGKNVWSWRLLAKNSVVLAMGNGYGSEKAARQGAANTLKGLQEVFWVGE